MTTRIPFVTLLISVCISAFQYGANGFFDLLVFDIDAISQGEWWRLLLGHFVHSDFDHYLWNIVAFILLGAYLELHSRKVLIGALLIGVAAIDLQLLGPWCSLTHYCGLSGVLNTLLVVALYLQWKQNASIYLIFALFLCIAKNAVEFTTDQSLFTASLWASYPLAHIVGMLGGVVLIVMFARSGQDTLS